VVPQDPVFSNYSAQGVMVSQIFKDSSNFPKLHELWLEKHCDLTKFLQIMISQYRSPDQLKIELNSNYSALTY
jgi:hypothetical protein